MPVTNSRTHIFQASLAVPLVKQRVFASMDLQYLGKRVTLAGGSVGAYVLPNFTLFTRKVLRGWEVSASVYNAFNQVNLLAAERAGLKIGSNFLSMAKIINEQAHSGKSRSFGFARSCASFAERLKF
jgi:hypothetical protein